MLNRYLTPREALFKMYGIFPFQPSTRRASAVQPLSYTILLEEVLAEKKCPQKHGGFSPEMTPLPWLLVPPAHEKTTDQAQN